ncbi:MAG: DUF2341 domain-containing protein, partial [Elusimicrobia bacterium]|nr:DUF2341 domain-containing protein [Elusimicrobiota bacterium]
MTLGRARAVLLLAAALGAGGRSAVWASGNWTETTDADFALGTFDKTYTAGTGAAAEVRLDYSGRLAGLTGASGPAWFNASWQYRRTIAIDSTNASTLADYQVALTLNTQALISGGRMNADGSDIRFTASDGTTPISHWVESGLNTTATKIWVKVPSIPASGSATVYLYYGYGAAASASSVTSTFVFGDDFSGSDGSAPNASKWSSIESSGPAAGSSRSIQSNALRLRFGTDSDAHTYGLRSLASPSFASGLRYFVRIKAAALGTGSTAAITLCPTSSASSEQEQDWLRLQFTQTATPRFKLDKQLSFIPFTLASDVNTTAGYHDVEFRLASSSMVVLVDGQQIYVTNGANFSSPFIYLESRRDGGALHDQEFDTMLVTKFSAPEPAMGATGAEQGRYEAAGTYASRVLDSGAIGSTVQRVDWDWTIPAGSSMTLRMRAHDSNIDLASFVAITSGAAPGIQGRYLQYRAELQTQDLRVTPALSSVTFSFTAAPNLPSPFTGTALTPSSIRWAWLDNSDGPWQEDGVRVLSSTGGLVALLPADATTYLETGLATNQQLSRRIEVFNAVGSTATALLGVYTLAPAPAVTVDRSTGVWYVGITTFNFANAAGFGAGAVQQYRYVWNTASTHTWTNTETVWSSGGIQRTGPASGSYYLHLRSYNTSLTPSGDADLGPFLIDVDFPQVPSFNPSSAPWTNGNVTVGVGLTDAGGSGLFQLRHQFTGSAVTPTTGWSTPDTSVTGSAATVQRIQFVQGVWYLHVEATDRAGNVTAANSGPYQMDLTAPTASVTINGGAAFATVINSTLTFSFSDALSGVVQMRCRNQGDVFPAFGGTVSSMTWLLTAGEGLKVVECEFKDAAGNVAAVSRSITLSKATTLTMSAVTTPATGLSAGQAKTFSPQATLTYSPTGLGITSATVSFNFLGVVKNALTDSQGRASVSYSVPSTTGTYLVTANFTGDINYTGSTQVADVFVEQRGTLIVSFNTTADTGGVATLQANLFDIETLENMTGKEVSITFEGSTKAVTTDGLGIARTTFTVPTASGTYTFAAAYAGDATYRATTGGAQVVVALRDTLLIADSLNTYVNDNVNARATLIQRSNGASLSGQTLSFVFRATTQTAVTDGNGVAVTAFPAGAASGSDVYAVSFGGNANLSPSTAAAAVGIGLRPVTVTPVAVSTTIAIPFAARASLLDNLSASGLGGLPVSFFFNGSTQTVLTDGLGAAATDFFAPASSGAYVFNASFVGDSTYQARNATAPVTAARRSTRMEAPAILANAASLFVASATVRDLLLDSGVAGLTVRLVFQGSTATVTTSAVGLATATFTGPTGIGDYTLMAAYDGSPVYQPASSTAAVTVNTRLTTLSASAASARWGEVFTASATLREQSTSQGVAARVVRFVFRGSTVNAVTDGGGLAGAVFTMAPSTGSFEFTAAFDGDAVYVGAASSATAVSSARPVDLNPQDVAVQGNAVFTGSATLTDGLGGAGVPGRAVQLAFEGSTQTLTTDGAGFFSATFTAAGLPRTSTLTAIFAGDALYTALTRTSQVAVGVRSSSITAPAVSVVASEVLTATATLTDGSDGAPLGGRSLSFVFLASTETRATSGAGVASSTFTAPAATGTYTLEVRFAGDGSYASRTQPVIVDVRRHPTKTDGVDVQAAVNSTFTARATLINLDNNQPLAGRSISFWFSGTTLTAVTDGLGVASQTFNTGASTQVATYIATFVGDATMAPSFDVRQVGIGLRFTSVVPFDVTTFTLDPFAGTAKLIDRGDGTPVAGQTITFQFQGSPQTGPLTDGDGRSTATYNAPAASGTYGLTADFGGNSIYVTSSGSSTIRVVPRPTFMSTLQGVSWGCWTLSSAGLPTLLLDGPSGTPLAGKTIEYAIRTDTASGVTDGGGVAGLNYPCGPTPGVWIATATFAGDATYAAEEATGTFSVSIRPTQITMFGGGVLALSTFSASAWLQDMAAGGSGLATKAVIFGFQSSTATSTGVSGSTGIAYGTFVAPASAGDYTISATFPTELSFSGSVSSATIGVGRRPTTLQAYDTWPWALDAFNVRADLTDSLWGNGIPGRTVTFIVTVGTATYTRTGLTNINGQAFSALFPAIATSAAYSFTASFAQDATYSASTGTANVYIGDRWTSIGASPVETNINADFQAQATLFDSVSNSVVGGKPLTFVFNGTTVTAVTNVSGIAIATFTATSQVGVRTYSVSFPGSVSYQGSANTGTVIQSERRVSIVAYTVDVSAGRGFDATAQLFDSLTGNPLIGSSVTFVFQGSTLTRLTDGVGVATASFTAPITVGTYQYTASFPGDVNFSAVTGTGTVNAKLRPTSMTPFGVTVAAQDPFSASAMMRDGDTSAGVAGKSIEFAFLGTTKIATTDALGIASATFNAPTSTGSYLFTASFAGDSLYAAGVDTGTVTAIRRLAALAIPTMGPAIGQGFTMPGTLTDASNGMALSGRSVRFHFLGTSTTVTTDGSGGASAPFTAPGASGTVLSSGTFLGDELYFPVVQNANVVVGRRPILLLPDDQTVLINDALVPRAKILDAIDSNPVQGRTIQFTFAGTTKTAATDSLGVATVTYAALTSQQTTNYYVQFAGDALYDLKYNTATITVNPRPTTLEGREPFGDWIYTLSVWTAGFKLRDSNTSAQIASRNVYFTFGTSSGGAVTDGAGNVARNFEPVVSSGTLTFAGTFPGDATYNPFASTRTLTVVRRWTRTNPETVTVYLGDNWNARATLTDGPGGGVLAGRPLKFTFGASSAPATTDGSGFATGLFAAPGAVGSYSYSAEFAGETSYEPVTQNATLSVQKRPSILQTTSVVAESSNTFTAQGRVLDSITAQKLAGKTVVFAFQSSTHQTTTDSNGDAFATFSAPGSSVTLTFNATFPGDSTYVRASDTTTVSVIQRATVFTASNVFVSAGASYLARAEYKDSGSGNGLAGRTIYFNYNGDPKTGVTDSLGVATAAYTAPTLTGSTTYSITVNGDPTYAGGSATGTVTVNTFETGLAVSASTVSVSGGVFTASATLTKVLDASPLNGKSVIFTFLGVNKLGTTQPDGMATVTYDAPSSSGTFIMSASFAGDSEYGAASGNGSVRVNPLPVNLAAGPPTSALANEVFYATATLTRASDSAGISDRTITFTFQGLTKLEGTDGTGKSTSTLIGASTGTWFYTATFSGDAQYEPKVVQGTVTVNARTSTLVAQNAAATYTLETFVASATLTDQSAAFIQGATVNFTYLGASSSSLTNASGLARVTYNAGASSGTYGFGADFPSNSTYIGSSDNLRTVSISPRPSSLFGTAASGYVNSVFTATATLRDIRNGGAAVAGRVVSFTYFGANQQAITSSVGIASTTFNSGPSTGTYSFSATYADDATYVGSSFTATAVTINSRPTALVMPPMSAYVDTVFTATATLTDLVSNLPLNGRTVTFSYQGTNQSDDTSASGEANSPFNANSSSGTYNVSATFVGDAEYNTSSATNTATIAPRQTSLAADPVAQVYANEVFTASGTLTDSVSGGAGVGNKTIAFVYFGNNQGNTTAVGTGFAAVTYNAGSSSGTYNYTASFAGDAGYGASNDNSNPVTVLARPTTLTAQPVASVFATEVLTTSATLTDDRLGGSGITGQTIKFTYNGQTKNGITNGSGLAIQTFNASASSGTVSFTATLDPNGTYLGSTDSDSVTVYPRPTALAGVSVPSVYTNSVFTASATLTDIRSGAVINGKTVAFTFLGNNGNGTTGAQVAGLAATTFNAGPSSGTYALNSSFAADATYVASSDTSRTVTINARPSTLAAQNASTYVGLVFTASATLRDMELGTAIVGRTIDFVYLGEAKSAATDATGLARVTYNAGTSSGAYAVTASFTTDGTYMSSSDTSKAATVNPRTTTLTGASVASVYATEVFTASATLIDVFTATGVFNRTVSFLYIGQSSSSLTTLNGLGTVTYNAGASSGTYSFIATYAGEAAYAPSAEAGKSVTVLPRPTTLAAVSVPAIYANETFTASATLRDLRTTDPIVGKPVTFVYLGVSSASLTNDNGLATVTYSAGANSGTNGFTATFTADATHVTSSDTSKTATVNKRPTALAGVDVPNVYTNRVFTASATLTDIRLGTALTGKTVTFTYLGQSSSSLTNGSGLATVTYDAGASSGTKSLSATFAADATYLTSSDTAKTVGVDPRPSSLAALDVGSVYANEVLTTSATLTDLVVPGGINGKQVTFVFLAQNSPVSTIASGLAKTTFNAGPSSGTVGFTATYAADATYIGSSDTARTVTILPRPTTLTAQAVSTFVNVIFTASATLVDSRLGTAVAGRTVDFVYLGQSSSSLTNASGLATVTYNSGVSSGTVSFSASFAADATYVGSSDNSKSASVQPRPTSLVGQAVASVYANEIFTASATLSDTLGAGGPVAGRTVTFIYLGQSSSSLTNASGLATVTYDAGPNAGAQTFTASYAGEVTYGPSSEAGKAVTVARRPTSLAGASVAGVPANELFTASATLTDIRLGGAPIVGRTVTFTYLGASSGSLTNGDGLATVTYNAGASSGTKSLSATFAQDSTYVASSDTAKTVTVTPRPTTLVALNVASVYTNAVFTASATLTDDAAGAIAGKTVTFVYLGVSSSSLTNAAGLATVTYGAGASSGTVGFSASFAADATYVGSSDNTRTVTINPRPTALAGVSVAAVYANNVFTASATLKDLVSNLPVSGKNVTFSYGGNSFNDVTDAAGLATIDFNAGASSGTYGFSASFVADATFVASSDTSKTVTVTPRPTNLAAVSVPGVYANNVFTASATLTDGLGAGAIAGRTVTFVYLGASSSSLTNASGLATVTYNAGPSSGTYGFTAAFSADATYVASADNSRTATVNPRPTSLLAVNVPPTFATAVFITTATLTDLLTGAPIASKTVTFVYQSQSSASLTNASGQGTVSYNAGTATGTYTYAATFPADATYVASSDTSKTVSVISRPSSLAAVSVPGVYASNIFTATATLTDILASAAIPGRTVTFVYLGVSSSSLTNGSGQATVTFDAGLSSGTKSYTASFEADATYLASSDTSKTVTVNPRPTSLGAMSVAAVFANEVWTASSTLTDLLSGQAVSGRTVSYSYLAGNAAGTTNGSGQAFATFNAGPSSGTHAFTASFAANETYVASSDTAKTVTVNQRPTTLTAGAIATVYANSIFTATATLTDDRLAGAPVAGQTITFVYLQTTQNGVTDVTGRAFAVFNAGPSSGTLNYTSSFTANGTYLAALDNTNAVNVAFRPSQVTITPLPTIYTASVFTASATVRDLLSGGLLSGRLVSFVFEGTTQTASTNGSGVASTNFTTPAASGTYTLQANVGIDSPYDQATGVFPVNVGPRPTGLVAQDVLTNALSIFTASATLSDQAGPVSGQTVAFTFDSVTRSGLSDAFGLATATFTAPSSSGTLSYAVQFSSTAQHQASSGTAVVTTVQRPTGMNSPDVTVLALDGFSPVSTLRDLQSGLGLSGQTVTFHFQGSSRTNTTDALGAATTNYAAPAAAGSYGYNATFAGTPTYVAISSAGAVTVLRRPTTLTPEATSVYTNAVFRATATLTDTNTGSPIAGRSVSFTFDGNTLPATTNASGVASVQFTAPASSGPYAYAAVFSEDATYVAASTSAAVQVNPRPTSVTANDVTVPALNSFSVQATVTDISDLSKVAGRTVSFVFEGATQTATTNGLGQATTSFFAPAVAAAYPVAIAFAESPTYIGSSGTISVNVTKRLTVMRAENLNAQSGTVWVASGTLRDVETAAPLSGKTIQFRFEPTLGFPTFNDGTTGADGVAGSTFMAPGSPATYDYIAKFNGDPTYDVSVDTGHVVVGRPTNVQAGDKSGIILSPVTLTAQLLDNLLVPLPNKPLQFIFNEAGATQTVTTDGSGNASATFVAPASSGVFTARVQYPGDVDYGPSSASPLITIVRRPASLAAFDGIGFVTNVFTAKAKLIDVSGGFGVSGATVSFQFQGSTRPGVSDGFGIASATFTAPASSGPYTFTANYPGSSIYDTANDTATITVDRIPAAIFMFDAAPAATSTFAASGRLVSLLTGQGIGGQSFSMTLEGLTKATLTDGSGQANISFTAPLSSGTYPITGSFAGNASYQPTTGQGVVAVGLRLTTLSIAPIAATSQVPFVATATLTDRETTAPLENKAVTLNFGASTFTLTTNALGLASATFTAPVSSGDYVVTASFPTDATYAGVSTTTLAAVRLRPTNVALVAPPAIASQIFSATATVTDVLSGAVLPGVRVDFAFNGFARVAFTDGTGIAYTPYTAPTTSGTYNLVATIQANAPYDLQSSTIPVGVLQRPSALVPQNASVVLGDVWRATATLTDAGTGAPVAGRTLSITLGTTTASALTNAFGVASATFSAPASSGTFTFAAAFPGDATYAEVSANAQLTATRRPLALTPLDVSVPATKVFVASATLADGLTAAPVAGLSIQFDFLTSSAGATSSAVGLATGPFTAPLSTGSISLTATFAGDSFYLPATSTATVSINSRPSLLLPLDVDTFVNAVFLATGTLTDAINGAVLSTRTVDFVFLATTQTLTTDGVGRATATFTAPASSGAYVLTARFAGDGLYAPDARDAAVRVALRPSLLLASDVAATAGSSFQAPARLMDLISSTPLSGMTLSFVFQGTTVTLTTDLQGNATASFSAPASSGTVPLEIRYEGNTANAPASVVVSVVIG